jgi:hypothetical protein
MGLGAINLGGFVGLVLAEGVSPDQERGLALVTLALVAFAAVFALIERRRIKRLWKRKDSPAEGGASGSPARPVVPPGTGPEPMAPEIYRPPVPDQASKQPESPSAEPGPVRSPAPSDDPRPVMPPASPDEIGIILPEDPETPSSR